MFIIPQLALGAKEAVSWMRMNQLKERLCASATIWLTLLCCLVQAWNLEKNMNLPYKRLDTLESPSHCLPWQSLYSSMLVSGKFNKIPWQTLFWHIFCKIYRDQNLHFYRSMHITCSLLVKAPVHNIMRICLPCMLTWLLACKSAWPKAY